MPQPVFFSDRTDGPQPRTNNEVTPEAWRGLVAVIRRHLADGSLAKAFPIQGCIDGPALVTGTDDRAFDDMLLALVPALRAVQAGAPEPWATSRRVLVLDPDKVPPTSTALDVVDFVLRHVARASDTARHDFFKHDHLYFDDSSAVHGQREFAEEVELIFQRNGVAYTVGQRMTVERLIPAEAKAVLDGWAPDTGDAELDGKLLDASSRFRSRSVSDRIDALEKLWDGFERLKTLELGAADKKKQSVTALIQRAAGGSALADALNDEADALTKIGNTFQIRHFEHGKHPLTEAAAVDYLFVRLAALIAYLLRQTGRM